MDLPPRSLRPAGAFGFCFWPRALATGTARAGFARFLLGSSQLLPSVLKPAQRIRGQRAGYQAKQRRVARCARRKPAVRSSCILMPSALKILSGGAPLPDAAPNSKQHSGTWERMGSKIPTTGNIPHTHQENTATDKSPFFAAGCATGGGARVFFGGGAFCRAWA